MFAISKKAIKDLDVADWENIVYAVATYVDEALYTMPSSGPEWETWSRLRDKVDSVLVAQHAEENHVD